MIARMCPVCGVVKATPGRCTRCARPANKRKAERANHAHVYNTTRWRRIRTLVLERDGHQCGCGAHATTAGHITPFTGASDPLAWDADNIEAQCLTCNGREAATRQAHGVA